jgi:hypothetical protein
MTKKFDKAALFAALKPKAAEVTVDGVGAVRIAQLSVAEVEAIRKLTEKDEAKKDLGLRFVIKAVVDEDGQPLFADSDLEDLRATSNTAMEALATEVLKHNGLLKDEAKN